MDIALLERHGLPDWIRTSGLRIRNPALYPAELRGDTGNSYLFVSKNGRLNWWVLLSLRWKNTEKLPVKLGHQQFFRLHLGSAVHSFCEGYSFVFPGRLRSPDATSKTSTTHNKGA